MSIALLVIDDGREDYLPRCLASIGESFRVTFDHNVTILDPDHKLGFSGAIQEGWRQVLETDAEYVFHVEGDFTFNRRVPVPFMQRLLEHDPTLAQVALKRQPWNEKEKAAGGIIEQAPENFEEHESVAGKWCTHSVCFTTNPSLYPRSIAERGWPQAKESEGVFSHQLRQDGYRFAYLGGKFDPPHVQHIGVHRTGKGY